MLRVGTRHLNWLILVSLCIIIFSASLFGASTGKLKGVLIDKESNGPVIGASVMIVGTTKGGVTDFDGKYLIRDVEPGKYQLKISSLEYNTVLIDDVVVTADNTTENDLALTKKVTELDEVITVKGKYDILDKFRVSTEVTISKETIKHKPVTTVDELLSQIAGVVTNQAGEIFIRGGRAYEVGYIVDGVPIGDPLGGLGQAGANLSLVSGSIQEFTVIKDGFDPEYGDALSGIVKITTQTGSKDVTRMNMQYITDDFGNSDLNKYSRNYDFVRFTVSGPDPFFKNKLLPALGINFFEDKELTYFFYAEMDKNDGIYQYNDYDTPITRRTDGSFNLLGFKIPERKNNNLYWMANIKFRPTQNMKMILSYKNSYAKYTIFDWSYRYSAATAPFVVSHWQTLSLEVSQSIHKNMNYEFIISYSQNGLEQKPGDPNNPGHGLDPDQFNFNYEWESFDDINRNGVYDPPEPIINLFPDTATYGTGFTGPAYTLGEFLFDDNSQGAVVEASDFRFNDNGILDILEGEPFIDLNNNGVWDAGDFLHDKNGNGMLDQDLLKNVDLHEPEPFIDGDVIIGEPFVDLNANDVYDPGIDEFVMSNDVNNMDINHNGRYDGPLNNWEPGIPYDDRNGNGIYDPANFVYDFGERFTDVNGNGRWDNGGSSTFFNPGSFSENSTWHERNTDTYRAELKLFLQIGNHELKLGAAIKREDLLYLEIQNPYLEYNGRPDSSASIPFPPYPERGAFRDIFSYDPWGGTVYFRDKLEYGSMIASLGFRWDFFIQDKYDLVQIARDDDLGSGIILGDRQKFSPRIGFSYPISDKAKVHFNYGHFFQRPAYQYMYQRNTTSVNLNTVIGNYNLDYQKTIQYSFGVKYAMSEYYSLDISGYFKDEFDKINSKQVRVGGLTRQQYRNSDYGRSRGFEFTLEKRSGGYINGMLSYVYAFAYGKSSQTNDDYMTDFELSRDPLDESPLSNDVRHQLNANVQAYIPNTVKPKLFGKSIPNGWSMDVQFRYESGRPFTPSRDYPNINTESGVSIQTNSLRMPSNVNFDIRFSKEFKIFGLDNKLIIWLENVFDSRNINYVYRSTGRPDTDNNPSGIIMGGTAFDGDPSNYDYGRQIRMGFEVNL